MNRENKQKVYELIAQRRGVSVYVASSIYKALPSRYQQLYRREAGIK